MMLHFVYLVGTYRSEGFDLKLCLLSGLHSLLVFDLQHFQLTCHGILCGYRQILQEDRGIYHCDGACVSEQGILALRSISHPLDFHLVSNPPQLPQLLLIEQSQAGRLHIVTLDGINFCLQQLVALLQRTHLQQPHQNSLSFKWAP